MGFSVFGAPTLTFPHIFACYARLDIHRVAILNAYSFSACDDDEAHSLPSHAPVPVVHKPRHVLTSL